MYCVRKIQNNLTWIGGNDRRLAFFENVYPIPRGVSYNSYILQDEKTVIFDCVDKAVSGVFFENIAHVLQGKSPDYLVVHHMEPDHSATIDGLISRYPDIKIVCNAKSLAMVKQFFAFDIAERAVVVGEGDTLCTGKHTLTFYMAPMVHWPEVMVSYDSTSKTLFSADAFGHFGALDGALFADEVDFGNYYMDEARRYYTNIVGKYGLQVQALLNKVKTLDICTLCPLHGFVWRKDIPLFVGKYDKWSKYEPEEKGVLIVCGSIYGNTENAAEILACKLTELGVKVAVYDVSVTHFSDILSEAFRFSHIVFASSTYNMGLFTNIETLVNDIVAHNLQNRRVAYIQNGSWSPVSAKLIAEALAKLKNITTLEPIITIKSSVKEEQLVEFDTLARVLAEDIKN